MGYGHRTCLADPQVRHAVLPVSRRGQEPRAWSPKPPPAPSCPSPDRPIRLLIDVRLIDRNDTSLVLALVASALVVFHQPLRVLFDTAREVELRYGLDLLPGLTVLVGTFGFHQYRKRHVAREAMLAAAAEAEVERRRAAELEQLVTMGQALGSALDPAAVRQVFWRTMPAFAANRELWMLTRTRDGWDIARDAAHSSARTDEALESRAQLVLATRDYPLGVAHGLAVDEDLCFPMLVGDMAVGVVGVRNTPPVSPQEASGIAAAIAVLAIAIRNAQLLEQTRESSIRDGLTGCFNRSFGLETLGTELKRARRTGRTASVMMIDIDDFKSVNDEHGHLTGDAVLAAIGARLAAVLRTSDVKCRYGGDEFLVILPDTPIAGAEHAASMIVDEMAHITVEVQGGTLSPHVSVGVAASIDGEQEPKTLIARADQALYEAKRSGRNRAVTARLAPAV